MRWFYIITIGMNIGFALLAGLTHFFEFTFGNALWTPMIVLPPIMGILLMVGMFLEIREGNWLGVGKLMLIGLLFIVVWIASYLIRPMFI